MPEYVAVVAFECDEEELRQVTRELHVSGVLGVLIATPEQERAVRRAVGW